MQCQHCGREIVEQASFCNYAESGSRPLFCGLCGNQSRPDASYCTGCGDQLLTA